MVAPYLAYGAYKASKDPAVRSGAKSAAWVILAILGILAVIGILIGIVLGKFLKKLNVPAVIGEIPGAISDTISGVAGTIQEAGETAYNTVASAGQTVVDTAQRTVDKVVSTVEAEAIVIGTAGSVVAQFALTNPVAEALGDVSAALGIPQLLPPVAPALVVYHPATALIVDMKNTLYAYELGGYIASGLEVSQLDNLIVQARNATSESAFNATYTEFTRLLEADKLSKLSSDQRAAALAEEAARIQAAADAAKAAAAATAEQIETAGHRYAYQEY